VSLAIAGRTSYRPETGADYLARVTAAPCDGEHDPFAAIGEAFVGTGMAGRPCESAVECSPELVCANKVCERKRAGGEVCFQFSPEAVWPCGAGLRCATSTRRCEVPSPSGSGCRGDDECRSNLCSGAVCRDRPRQGQECIGAAPENDCALGLSCTVARRCAPLSDVDGPCDFRHGYGHSHVDCRLGLFCLQKAAGSSAGTCGAPREPGEACMSAAECAIYAKDLKCIRTSADGPAATCQPARQNGEPCLDSRDCAGVAKCEGRCRFL